jgi:lysophospholipase L1-like esterase
LHKFKLLIPTLFLLWQQIHVCAQHSILESGLNSLSLTGCSNSGGVIGITGTGSIQSNKAYFSSETALDEIDMNFEVRVDTVSSTGAFRFGIGKYSGIAGTMVEFSGNLNSTNVIINRLNNTTPVFITQFPLPFNLVIGDTYKIRVGKRVRQLVVEVTSNDSTDYFIYDSLSYPAPYFGCLWGTPFIGCTTGKIGVTDFTLSTPLSTAPRLAVWGDSFIEGNALGSANERYVSLIKDSIGYNNVSIMGRGGETSASVNSRFSKEATWFKDSKYGLIAIGVNDNNFILWKNNILKHIDTLKKHNIIPIIATLSPRSDRLPFIAMVNSWIRNDYNGAYIDVGSAVSTASASNWIPGMGMTDSIHPSVAGHQAIFDRIKIEAPYLFRDTSAFTINYFAETTNENVSASLIYSSQSDFNVYQAGSSLQIPVIPGETVFFRDTLSAPGINTLYDLLPLPVRPNAPSNPVTNPANQTFDWTNNPLFPDVSDYEYSIDSGALWTTCFQKPIVNPGSATLMLRLKASNQNFKSDVLFFDIGTGVLAFSPNSFTAFPNPFSDVLSLQGAPEGSVFTIFSSEGRAVKSGVISSAQTVLNTEDLKAGFYILNLSAGNFDTNIKLIRK